MSVKIFRNRVSNVLKEESEKDRIKIEGVIVRLKDDSPDSVFWVKTFDSRLSRISLPKERRAKVIQYLSERVPIRVFGVDTKKKHTEVVEIDGIEENRELIIDQVSGNLLKEPIKADVSFEKYDDKDDFWVVSIEELGVVGVDNTVEKARKVFEEDLYEFYKFYREISDDELTERTVNAKRKLIQIFESKT
jgi:hypothetical protein